MLIAPILLAHGVDDAFLTDMARAPENTRLIPGAVDAVRYLRARDEFFLISTSYSQYVRRAAELLGVPFSDTYSTSLPIDDLRSGIQESDISLVREWTAKIAEMPVIEMNESGGINEDHVEAKNSLDEFFWEILPGTSFARMMDEVRPVGGERKFQSLLKALNKQDKTIGESRVIGDSITDSVMLSKAKEAGALAISFNGNRYSIPNSNIAVLSGNCWATAVILDLYEEGGLDLLRELSRAPGDFISSALSAGMGEELEGNLSREFTDPVSRPKVYWVDQEESDAIIRESEAFRKMIRGEGIGSLG
jgi:energy-converting hydrogenase A subunit R